MKNGILKRRLTHIAGSASAVILLGGMLTGCKDDLLTGMPSWLGSSIYEWLENPRNLDGSPYDGTFNETLKLINAQNEDYASVLKKTGSKTLFVADDASWQEFYKSNPWGVKSIEDLTDAQKKLLFKSNMINSAYLMELLGNIPAESSTSDPIEGSCMRRNSSVDLSDTIPVITSSMYPVVNPKRIDNTDPDKPQQVDWWEEVRGKDTLKIFMDDQVATMIHFMPKFMQNSGITNDDVEFMTNGGIKSNEDGFVNGKVVKMGDVTCQNGYIHVLDGVGLPSDNMANVIANNPKFSIYNRLLDRFSYPLYDQNLSNRYGNGDSIFVKRYFNSSQNHALKQTSGLKGFEKKEVKNMLSFDPGWNRYIFYTASGLTYQYDAAMMLVPTDEAMRNYLKTDGADIAKMFGTPENEYLDAWDNAPDEVVIPLLDNTMHMSLKSAIPSNFNTIMNSASERMGVEKKDIDYVHWACNGVIYETNKVYIAPEYVSVYYPCVIRGAKDLSYMNTTIENDNKVAGGEGFKAYLNNMGSKYSFIIPTNNALGHYYDPVSYKRTDSKDESTAAAWVFSVNKSGKITADAYMVDWTDSTNFVNGAPQIIVDDEHKLKQPAPVAENNNSSGSVFNHMKDIINSSMAMGLFTPGQKFYQSKAGGPIIVDWDGDEVRGVAGSFQYERGYYVPVVEVFDKSQAGNGRSYIVDDEPLQSTTKSPYSVITDPNSPHRSEFQAFASLLEGCNFIGRDDHANHTTMDNALTILSNYHYTIYVPTSSSIEQLIADHKLPTGEDRDLVSNAVVAIEEAIDEVNNNIEDEAGDTIPEKVAEKAALQKERAFLMKQDTIMKDVMENFVSYHIQDNSIYVDNVPADSVYKFESACLDTATTRFSKITVKQTTNGELILTDNKGLTHKVDPVVNNILTRQYFFNSNSLKGNGATEIHSSSYAVIHLIDSPMMPFQDEVGVPYEEQKHPDNGYYNPETYKKVMEIVNKYYTEEAEEEPAPSTVKRHKR